MKRSNKDINNYNINNPDGLNFESIDNRVAYINDNNNFIIENNVQKVVEKELINEIPEYSNNAEQNNNVETKKEGLNFNNSLLAVSSAVASSVVAVASAVIIGVFLFTNGIINVSVFVCSSNSITFYIQANINQEEGLLIAELYNEQTSMINELVDDSFMTFDGLESDTEYTLSIYFTEYPIVTNDNMNSEKVIYYSATFKTEKEDCVQPEIMRASLEEDGTLRFSVYVNSSNKDKPIQDDLGGGTSGGRMTLPIDFYTVLVLDSTHRQLYTKDETENGKFFEIDVKDEGFVYVCARYIKNGIPIGRMQMVELYI